MPRGRAQRRPGRCQLGQQHRAQRRLQHPKLGPRESVRGQRRREGQQPRHPGQLPPRPHQAPAFGGAGRRAAPPQPPGRAQVQQPRPQHRPMNNQQPHPAQHQRGRAQCLAGWVAPLPQAAPHQQHRAHAQQVAGTGRAAPVPGGVADGGQSQANEQGVELGGHHRQRLRRPGRQPPRRLLGEVGPGARPEAQPQAARRGGLAPAAARREAAQALHRQPQVQRPLEGIEGRPTQPQPAPQRQQHQATGRNAAQGRAHRECPQPGPALPQRGPFGQRQHHQLAAHHKRQQRGRLHQ